MPQKRPTKSIRSMATSPIVDIHIGLPQDVLNMLDDIKEEMNVSRSVVISELIKQEHAVELDDAGSD